MHTAKKEPERFFGPPGFLFLAAPAAWSTLLRREDMERLLLMLIRSEMVSGSDGGGEGGRGGGMSRTLRRYAELN